MGNEPTECWPWTHKWSKWRVFQEGPLMRRTHLAGVAVGEPVEVGWWQRQARDCQVCGYRQIKDSET